MPAKIEYLWNRIGPGANVGVYIHGFPDNRAMVYSATVFTLTFGGQSPFHSIELTQGQVDRHVDLTLARTAWVHNSSSSDDCSVQLNSLYDTF